ncbi:sensor histidine kinase [Nocardioides scoriae]|uniref:sensor histidine kinase n=1 Tax=Nocardioides scoriae TaxID=642780 RepID=UPI000B8449F6|nr:histidine kinase [Nocardioides scoriae]
MTSPRTSPTPGPATGPGTGPDTTPDPEPARSGLSGGAGIFFIVVWTLFLVQPLVVAWQRRDARGYAGLALVLLFVAVYLSILVGRRRAMRSSGFTDPRPPRALLGIAVCALLAAATCLALGQVGTATAVYVCVLCTMTLPRRWGLPAALLTAAVFFASGVLVPGWEPDGTLLLSMLAATLAVWGIQQVLVRNAQLVQAQHTNRSLAVANERNRFARDLHDILGHSLTVITVKAELARRLLAVDPVRAEQELADLERLSRDALDDVRRAVEGYRDLTLPGELARARQALATAQIEADLPNATDMVPTQARELFAWTVREGVTNVIRHSHARHCQVVIAPGRLEVRDDGRGPAGSDDAGRGGHGLLGLRERAAALGGSVQTETLDPGFRLAVVLP